MRRFAFKALALFAAVACTVFVHDAGAGWGGGVCPPNGPVGPTFPPPMFPAPVFVQPAPFVPAPAAEVPGATGKFDRQPGLRGGVEYVGKAQLEWREYHNQRGTFYLHDASGRRVGAWREKTCQFWPLDGRAWKAECRPPCDLPRGKAVRPELNFGIIQSKISEQPRYWVGDRVVSREECVREIVAAGEELKDDSGKLRVTFFGPEAKTQPLKAAVKAQADLDVLVQAYETNDPMIANLGFETDGAEVTVYCQTPAGKVLHRQPGVPDVPGMVEAVRKANGSYKAAADPNLSKPNGLTLPNFDLSKVPQWLWLVLGAAALLWLVEQKK